MREIAHTRDKYPGILSPIVEYSDAAHCVAPGITGTCYPKDVSTSGTKPSPRGVFLWCKHGYTREEKVIDSICLKIYSTTALSGGSEAVKQRLCLVKRDAPWEQGASLKGLPNGVLLGSTGLGITNQAARTAWQTASSTADMLRFQMSASPAIIPANTPFTLFGLCEILYTNVTSPDTAWDTVISAALSALPNNRASRLASQQYARGSYFAHSILTTEIDSIDWATYVLPGAGLNIIDWSGYSDTNLHNAAHWLVYTEGAITGGASGSNMTMNAGVATFRSGIHAGDWRFLHSV